MPQSRSSNYELKINSEGDGSYLVLAKNKKRLLYDGLMDTFSIYGQIATICDKGHRGVIIRFVNLQSALDCYEDLCHDPDFMVLFPDKDKYINVDDKPDTNLDSALTDETKIIFQKSPIAPESRIMPQKSPSDIVKNVSKKLENVELNEIKSGQIEPLIHYVCRKRKVLRARAFKRCIISLSALNQYKKGKNDHASLISEINYQMRGVSLDFETGFEEEIENDVQMNEIPQLILAQDLYFFEAAKIYNAVDVLVSGLPPWYQQIDVYKLILPHVSNDLLRIDWYRMYTAGSNECSLPYAIVYLKTRQAACSLRYCADELVIASRKISVCLMEDVERMLLEVRRRFKMLEIL